MTCPIRFDGNWVLSIRHSETNKEEIDVAQDHPKWFEDTGKSITGAFSETPIRYPD